ncbi:transcriptional regulator [Trinickia violacea]|uniref:Transcriptional regulator n=1 Tax=Trinickia violacea TaxID=2571746 RepID=A0A4P8IZZ3_9BURK|nr:winged helix-turn-helix domain-containing protein [Trinickia violacea]QCP53635.1 transcriptional regulator [Trinickia violacea]
MIQIGQLDVFLENREVRSNGESLRIGSRAFDILEVLIRAGGALVSKDEIIRAVWPNVVVQENNLQVHIAALRKALAGDRDLIRTVPGRGYRLVAANPEPAVAREPMRPLRMAPAHGMPYCVSSLVGREATIAEIVGALDTTKVVTLVGAGGIGKTRIAIEVAAQIGSRFADGVVFVPFASVSDPRFALDALAAALGLPMPVGRLSLDDIASRVAGRHMLLLLDNCEHLIDEVAQIASAISEANEGLYVLATSREALRVPGELLYPVQPLDVPDEGGTAEDILAASAVQLFVDRARAADPRFPLDDRTLLVTGLICRRLDGIPLAVELAAARAAVLGVEVLAEHLDDHFRILAGGFRTALPRHQTLKAMLDWSYRLLDDTERALLRSLGVFMNGFSFDAAYHVIKERGFSCTEVLDALSGLVAKSLVVRESEEAATRYRLLEITRAYALKQLEDHGERKAAALAHATYFRAILSRAPTRLAAAKTTPWFMAFRHELGNLRAALDWAFAPDGDRAVGIALAAVAVPCLFDLSLVDECCERARAALDAMRAPEVAPVPAESRLPLLAAYGAALLFTQGPVPAVHEAWSEVLSLAVATNNAEFELRALWGLWSIRQYGGDAHAALQLARRFGALAQMADHPAFSLVAGRLESVALHYAGEPEAARERLGQLLCNYECPTDHWGIPGFRIEPGIVARATLARVLWTQGETSEALKTAQCALEAALCYGHDIVTCYVLVEGLVPVALLSGEFELAREGIALLRTRAKQGGFMVWLACSECYDQYLKSIAEPDPTRLPEFRAALDAVRQTGYLAQWTMLLAQYARALNECGRREEAEAVLDEALQHCAATGDRWFYLNLCRLGADLATRSEID